MKVQEYFSQGERYFSESQGQFQDIDSMPPPYALNAWRKLLNEYGEEFQSSALSHSLLTRILPQGEAIKKALSKFGKAGIFVGEGGMKEATARARLRAGGAASTRLEGDWMYGYAEDLVVTVRPA